MSFYHPVNGPLWPTIMALDLALSDQVVFKTDIDACKKAAADFVRIRYSRHGLVGGWTGTKTVLISC